LQDEGIVQPVSKEMDQLSRRLHQTKPLASAGGFFMDDENARNGRYTLEQRSDREQFEKQFLAIAPEQRS
jgi:hypothetical protein